MYLCVLEYLCMYSYVRKFVTHSHVGVPQYIYVCSGKRMHVCPMGWLRLVGSSKLYVSFAKEPYKRDYILQKRPIILRSVLIVATPYMCVL